MKTLLKILVGVLVVLAVLFVVLELSLDKMILKGFNAAAPGALGVEATLANANISLLRGKAALSGLHIGNPEGFNTPGLFDLGSVRVDIDNSTLLSDTMVIREITIEGLELTYEKGLLNSNLGALIDQLSAGKEEKPEEEGPREEVELVVHRHGGRREGLEELLPSVFRDGVDVLVGLSRLEHHLLAHQTGGLELPERRVDLVEAEVVGHHQLAGDVLDLVAALGA